jgi:hypothetical protein
MNHTLENFDPKNRKEFVKFIGLLIKDYERNYAVWENLCIEDFLYAIQSYAEDIDGYYKNTNQKINADEPSWKVFADILKGARVYE